MAFTTYSSDDEMSPQEQVQAERQRQEMLDKRDKKRAGRAFKKKQKELEFQIASGQLSEKEAYSQAQSWIEEQGFEGAGLKGAQQQFTKKWGGFAAEQKQQAEREAAASEYEATAQAGLEQARGTLEAGLEAGKGTLEAGQDAALGRLEAGAETAKGELAAGLAGAQKTIQAGRETVDAKQAAAGQELKDIAQPWLDTAGKAVAQREQLMGLSEGGPSPAEVLKSLPGYQFRLEEGLKATQRMQSARGSTLSGAAMKELQARGEGLASAEFGRHLDTLNRMSQEGLQAGGTLSQGLTSLANTSMTLQAGLSQTEAGMQQGTAMATADITTRMANAAAGIVTDTARQVAGMEYGAAGATAGMEHATAMQTGGAKFSAATGFDMQQMQQEFQRGMAEWEAGIAKKMAADAEKASVFGSILKVGGAIAGAAFGGPAGAAAGGAAGGVMGDFLAAPGSF